MGCSNEGNVTSGAPKTPPSLEEIKVLWNKHDRDADGFITKDDISYVFRFMCDSKLPKHLEADIEKGTEAYFNILLNMDTSGDGKISKDEFFTFMKVHPIPDFPPMTNFIKPAKDYCMDKTGKCIPGKTCCEGLALEHCRETIRDKHPQCRKCGVCKCDIEPHDC